MKKIFNLLIFMLGFSTVVEARNIYLIRHAEKADDGSKDPVLTVQGQKRAKNIAAMLSQADIKQVYATNYQRTQLTARPMADFLGVTITPYDPSQLSDFSEHLKRQTGNALVVGHSNTTPMLTYLLSGKPLFNLDENDFDNVFQVVLEGDNKGLNVFKSLPSKATDKLSIFEPDHARFFNGELVFNRLYKSEVVGQSKQVFKSKDNQYILHEHIDVQSMGFKFDTEVVVNSETLKPKYLHINGIKGGPIDVQFNWSDDLLTGHSQAERELFKVQGKLTVEQTLRSQTLERSGSIMLAHLMPVSKDSPLLINWFSGTDGSQRLITISYQGEEQISVPAGTFDTYKIKYSGGAPSQYYWIDKKQAKVVKVDLIKSPWVYELVDFTVN